MTNNIGIRIQIGSIFMNRTRKYLLPIIKYYGTEFTFNINSMFKVAIGIGDIVLEKCGFKHEKHLFILIDSLYKPTIFLKSLKWIRNHPAYEDDYIFGNVKTSRFHMLVIQVPEYYIPSFENFKESKFSKMYSKEDINKLFEFQSRSGTDRVNYENAHKVLIHDHNYKVEFAKQVREQFDVQDFNVNDISDTVEFDLPIRKTEEIFNYKQEELDK
jgi:hypothetical protein